MECLILCFDAPMMSFGGVLVDQHNPTERFPGRAMLTGLLGNALGWTHGDATALNSLQARIEFAARWDISPKPHRDYQTADLGQPHLRQSGWTTRGIPEHRAGRPDARYGTHQRYRHYWADGVMTIALAVGPGDPGPNTLAEALKRPARPLFIGRKNCLPASRIFRVIREARDPLAALQAEPRAQRVDPMARRFEACWPLGCAESDLEERQRTHRTDDRDWRIQAHVGLRPMVTGYLTEVPPCT